MKVGDNRPPSDLHEPNATPEGLVVVDEVERFLLFEFVELLVCAQAEHVE